MRHGIDFKTHSQCQRSGQIPHYRTRIAPGTDIVSSSLEYVVVAQLASLVEPIGIEPMTSSLQS